MDFKNENEISLKDIASSEEDEYKDDKFDEFKFQSDDEQDLMEFWEGEEKKKVAVLKERNPNIDVKLEEYLRSHSQQLSLHIQ